MVAQKRMLNQQYRMGIIYAWLIISGILLITMLAPYLVPESTLLAASGMFQLKHHDQVKCPICGMTRSFIAITDGNISEAMHYNRWSILVYGILLINKILAAIFLIRRI